MKSVKKMVSLLVSACMMMYAVPGSAFNDTEESKVELTEEQMANAVGAGGLDVAVEDYFGGSSSATITNRTFIPTFYTMNVTDINGNHIETIQSGSVTQFTSATVSGTPSFSLSQGHVVNVNTVNPGAPGVTATDTYSVR